MTIVWSRLLVGGSLFAVLSALAAAGPYGAPRIAANLQKAAEKALQQSGQSWAQATADGRVISVLGTAPNERARLEAKSAIGSINGIARVETVGIATTEAAEADDAANEGAAMPTAEAETPIAPAQKELSVADCQALINRSLNGRRLIFRHKSVRLSSQDRDLLGELAASLAECGDFTLVIEGHSDSTGSRSANFALSERRARVVEKTLGELGPGLKLVVRAYGESRPIASNQTAEGRAANRRIDFVVADTASESD